MDESQALLNELEQIRERATGLIRAKLNAIAEQFQEAASRAESDLEMVVPPDLEAFFPLAHVGALIPAPPQPVAVSAAGLDLDLLRVLDGGRAQSAVLQDMLRGLEPWAEKRAVVVFREGRVSGWAGAGLESPDAVRGWQGELSSSPALSRAAAGVPVLISAADDALLDAWLPGAERVLAVPMSLRGKIVGTLIAVPRDGGRDLETIQVATFVTGLLLETLSVRTTTPTPALAEVEVMVEPGGEPVAQASEPEPEPLAEEAAAPLPSVEPAPEAEVPQAEAEAAAEPEEEEVDEGEAAVTAMAAPAEPESEADFEDAGATVQLKVPVTPVTPVRSPDDERKHEEARRFARLLVSEIRLYNEQSVVDGKQTKDIYQRLKEDIDRSREMYEQRVSAEVRSDSNYFFEELVRILADGDADALGL